MAPRAWLAPAWQNSCRGTACPKPTHSPTYRRNRQRPLITRVPNAQYSTAFAFVLCTLTAPSLLCLKCSVASPACCKTWHLAMTVPQMPCYPEPLSLFLAPTLVYSSRTDPLQAAPMGIGLRTPQHSDSVSRRSSAAALRDSSFRPQEVSPRPLRRRSSFSESWWRNCLSCLWQATRTLPRMTRAAIASSAPRRR